MDYKTALTEYIRNDVVKNRKKSINEDEDLLSSGLIDSLGILMLVSFIEDKFGIQVPGEDVVYENFSSIEAMSRYLAGHENN
jgi:acyl carrier protein